MQAPEATAVPPAGASSSTPPAPPGSAVPVREEGRQHAPRWPVGSALRHLLLWAPAVFALHNAEESATMARWARDQLPGLLDKARAAVPPDLPPGAADLLQRLQPPTPGQFYWAAAVATVVPALLYWTAAARGLRSRWTTVAVWCQALFLLNIFLPHLTASLALRRYTPGVVSALLLNLPLSWLIFRAALREGVLSRHALGVFLVSAVVGYAAVMGALLALARELSAMTAGGGY